MSCWACDLARGRVEQHKTEWFYLDLNGIVVEDLDPKGAKLRLLYVPREHAHAGNETPPMKREAKKRLGEVARWLNGKRGYGLGKWDDSDFKYPQHWHMQLSLVEEQCQTT